MTPLFEPIQIKDLLNSVKVPSMPFDWSINPYRGCQHGCSFCYARSTHAFLGLGADDTFQNHILYKANAVEALEAQVQRILRARNGRSRLQRIAIGTATDPYQPLEAKTQLTRRCLEVLAAHQLPVSITTRSPLILRDLDLLRRLPGSSVNISLNTLDNTIWRGFEPMTPSPAKRLDALRRMNDAGVTAGVFLAPILPFLSDSEDHLDAIVRASHNAGSRFVMGSVLRLSTQEVKQWFFATLRERYPGLVPRYAQWYARAGSAPEDYRREIRSRLNALLQQYGVPAFHPEEHHSRAASAAAPVEEPVQLAFSFD